MSNPASNREEALARVQIIFRSVFDDDSLNISEETSSADIEEWDSLNHIILVIGIEKEFGVALNAAQIGNLANVGEMINLLV